MLRISFEPNSLLFGESFLWAGNFLILPLQLRPNFARTRSSTIFTRYKLAGQVLKLLIKLQETVLIGRSITIILNLFQPTYYGLLALKFGPMVQQDLLLFVNMVDQDELTYKVLYFGPLVVRFVILFQLLLGLYSFSRQHYKEWDIYDHFNVFNVEPGEQLKIMISSLFVCLPDFLRSFLEFLVLLSLLQSERYNMFLFESKVVAAIFVIVFYFAINATYAIRAKPMLNVIYSELCLQLHLRRLRSKLENCLSLPAKGFDPNAAEPIAARENQLELVEFEGTQRSGVRMRSRTLSGSTLSLLDSKLAFDLIDSSHHITRPHQSTETRLALPLPATSSISSLSSSSMRPLLTSASSTSSSSNSCASRIKSPNASDSLQPAEFHEMGRNEAPEQYTIGSLFELEKHLTQLYLFVTALDEQTASFVYLAIIVNFMLSFHGFLYVREIQVQQLNWLLAIIFCAGPALPLLLLLLAGHLIELECKQIATLIEKIYYDDSRSQMLLFKQMKHSQHSLTRVFHLLASIRFSCHHLVELNLETAKNLVIYSLSGMFIIAQYDMLLAAKNTDGRHRATSPTTAIAAAAATNGTNLIWNTNRPVNAYEPHLFHLFN